ncbi:hypothetical protein HYH03_013710 [Edaphochlamys debaryana]|uniref:NFACT RNA-binding domain-containing protein n=1 Tax=Edaphochlamys debaryana TaxID=47281 RepID=A0A835XPK8_9CHLO|nr:hypothetical protein HYH03_013710 [Edaphochlamys debaryana]|eukprot:KAG2487711.1 hypothetical protein HYH03_013710 [Edaphochlamys debaryana]
MVKQRMSSADVAAEVACLRQRIIGLRVANIYDLTAKTYVLKLARSGEEGEKVHLLLESGSRFHTTKVLREKTSEMPSNFTLKLRKHCRTRRVEAVRQLGVDRCMELTLGSGPGAVHLILEMYAQGNIVLTDANYEVLTLLRSHRDDAKGLVIMARHPYPMAAMRLATRVTPGQLDAAAPRADSLKALVGSVLPYGPTIAEHVVMDAGLDPHAPVPLVQLPTDGAAAADGAAADVAAAADDGVGIGLGAAGEEAEAEVEGDGTADPDAVQKADAAAAAAAPKPVRTGVLTDDVRHALLAALGRLDDWFARWEAGELPKGYITLTPPGSSAKAGRKKKGGAAAPAAPASSSAPASGPLDSAAAAAAVAAGELIFAEFNPLPLLPYAGQPSLPFDAFDDALDEFYSKIEGQRADIARADAERAATSRLDKIKADQGSRAAALLVAAEEAELKAQLITYNLTAVDAALDAVNTSLATGMDWSHLEALIRDERRAGNPVAGSIAGLNLADNQISLLLANTLDDAGEEGDEEANTRRAVKVAVDLSLTAHANASAYFDTRRKHLSKHAKTVAANEQAFAAAEKKAEAALKQVRAQPAALQPVRKPMWFERFAWFVSSENYLVVSGRDAQQNELLVKRYFRKGDIYVHAELHGASSTIIKNPTPDLPVPPLTLQQAGLACVCRSRAWDSKIVTSAWWVHHHQVSKTAPTGEYLVTGSFMIRGKKNFLPPQPLVMGFGFLFRLDDSSIPAHLGERAVRSLDPDAMSVLTGRYGNAVHVNASGGAEAIEEGDEAEAGSDAEAGSLDGDGGEARAGGGGGSGGGGGGLTSAAVARKAAPAAGAAAPSPLDRFLEGSYDMPYGGATTAAVQVTAAQYERYGLSHAAEEEDGEGDGAAAAGPSGSGQAAAAAGGAAGAGGGRRHLSAKERALLKKGGKPGGAGGGEDEEYTIVGAEEPGPAPGGGGKAAGGAKGGAAAGAGAAAAGGKGQPPGGAAKGAAAAGAGPAAGKGAAGAPAGGKGAPAAGAAGGAAGAKGAPAGGGKGGKGAAGAAAAAAAAAAAKAAAAAPAPASSQRGKKGKQARVKDKYADQDEEERLLALAVLGSAGDKKTRTDRRKERKQRKEAVRAEGRAATAGDEDERRQAIERATGKQFARTEADGSSSGSESEAEAEAEAKPAAAGAEGGAGAEGAEGGAATAGGQAKEGGEGGGEGGAEEDDDDAVPDEGQTEAEKAEIAALLAEENVEAPLADEDAARLSLLDALTGVPRTEDVLLYAVPVCGPYAALQSYKYKVKVTPGTLKKGKAARQAMELLMRAPEVPTRERDVLRAIPEMEAINCLVGPVKLSMPGLQKLKTEDKKTKKAKAQARAAAGPGGGGKE